MSQADTGQIRSTNRSTSKEYILNRQKNSLTDISLVISKASGKPFAASHIEAVQGGWINEARVLSDGEQRYFVKLNQAVYADMFAAEAESLVIMARTQPVRVPKVITHGCLGEHSFIVLEYLTLSRPGESAEKLFGKALASMHRQTSTRFGLDFDNTIGSTPQQNNWREDWPTFYLEQRLQPIFQLAVSKYPDLEHYFAPLARKLPDLFREYQPRPSLVHGDLWSGNWAEDAQGQPVLFDPALYWGDREVDLAMTELFGGFSEAFYRAYQEAWPLDSGYVRRKALYQLYYYLNHIYLFGENEPRYTRALIERALSD